MGRRNKSRFPHARAWQAPSPQRPAQPTTPLPFIHHERATLAVPPVQETPRVVCAKSTTLFSALNAVASGRRKGIAITLGDSGSSTEEWDGPQDHDDEEMATRLRLTLTSKGGGTTRVIVEPLDDEDSQGSSDYVLAEAEPGATLYGESDYVTLDA